MSFKPYHRTIRWLHWTVAALVCTVVALGFGHELIQGAWRGNTIAIHKNIGFLLLLLMIGRLIYRGRHAALYISDTPQPRWQSILRASTHGLFYILLLWLPLSGWAMVSAFGRPLLLAGVIPMPMLLNYNKDIGVWLKHWHSNIAFVLLGLVLLHVAAALYHHVIKRDDVLKRMLYR